MPESALTAPDRIFIRVLLPAPFSPTTAALDELKVLLLPRDPSDDKNVILEVRAGTGGEEAALFAGDLLRMYLRWAERHRFRAEVMALNETGIGGVKEAVVEISGDGAYSRLKYESGTHRVQRVPATEAQGRIHTSTATRRRACRRPRTWRS